MGRIGSFSAVGDWKRRLGARFHQESARAKNGKRQFSKRRCSAYLRPGFHIDTPEGAINRLRTILRKKTALIVLDDCRRSHRQRRAFDWGETGLATPRR